MLVSSTQHRAGASRFVYHQAMKPQRAPQGDQCHANGSPLREPQVMLSDLVEEMIWPRVLRAPALALSLGRLSAGCIAVFLVALISYFYNLLRTAGTQDTIAQSSPVPQPIESTVGSIIDSITSLDPVGLTHAISQSAMLLRNTVMQDPLITLLLGVPVIAVLALAGGTIARSTAFEFAQGRFATREESVHFTLRRARQFIAAIIAPIAFCAALFLLISLMGLLLSLPVVDLFGAVLYLLMLVLGIIATVVLVVHVLALPMLVPALSVEGTDAFDAIQRCYAYVIGRPLRYFSYVLLLCVLGVIAATIALKLASLSLEMTDWAASFIANDATQRALTGDGELGATKRFAHQLIETWRSAVHLIVAGYIVSLFFTSATLLYLAIRRICDGQGLSEIWEPVQHD